MNTYPAEQVQSISADYSADMQAVARQLLVMTSPEPKCWQTLLNNLDRLDPSFGRQVLSEAEAHLGKMEPPIKLVLRNKLRKVLHHRNQFHRVEKNGWQKENLNRLHEIYQALAPDDLIQREAWLFDSCVEYPIAVSFDWENYNAKVKADRLVVAEQLATLGIEPILGSLKEFQDRYALGYALGSSTIGSNLAVTLFRLHAESEVVEVQEFIQGFASALFVRDQQAFLAKWVLTENDSKLSEKGIATLLLGLPCELVIWNVAEQCGIECDRLYWLNVFIGFFNRLPEAGQAARKLLAVGRSPDAINVLAANISADWLLSLDGVELVVDVLRAGITTSNSSPEHAQRTFYNNVETLLQHLIKCGVDDEILIELEWAYFDVLQYSVKRELVIHKNLITNPNLLVDLLGFCYRSENSSNDDYAANFSKRVKTFYLNKSVMSFFIAAINLLEKSFIIFSKWLSRTCNNISFRFTRLLRINDLCLAFSGRRVRDEPSEQDKRRASRTWKVLNSWHPFENISSQEMSSCDQMVTYTQKVRVIAEQRGLGTVADYQLGQALSSCPIGTDGNWPHEAVCQLIEQLQSPELCKGFVVGRQNARGVTTRGIGEGGIQEQKLAGQYRAWQEARTIQFPKASALIGKLAEHYERDAVRWDIEERSYHPGDT